LALAEEATAALNQGSFGMPGVSQQQAATITETLHLIRTAAGDI